MGILTLIHWRLKGRQQEKEGEKGEGKERGGRIKNVVEVERLVVTYILLIP